jgi:hypothetical protein
MDVVQALICYRNEIKTFLPIFDLKKNISYFKILINLRKKKKKKGKLSCNRPWRPVGL